MSIQYIATVLDRVPGLSSAEAFVLTVLANSASDDTHECWPSIRTVSRRTRLAERTVRRCLRRLEELKLIDTSPGGHQYGRNTASRYRLMFDPVTGATLAELPTRGTPRPPPGVMVSDKGDIRDRQGGHSGPPSVIDPSLNQRGAKSAERGATAARAAAAMTDAELEERARAGKLTAAEEYEREHRRRFRKAAV